MYFRCGKIELAWRVFDESSERDHVGSVHFDSTTQRTCSCVLTIVLLSFFLYLCHFEPNPTKDPSRRALGPEPDIVDLKKKDESRQQPIWLELGAFILLSRIRRNIILYFSIGFIVHTLHRTI
ncbi:uncharacterized protein DS421_10g297530 [Arachis hypogaea]|nr:uncharacterized protein DS421_10g297530 [Arachis hypogaea]